MSWIATPRSTFICCRNNHLLAVTNRDLRYGEHYNTDGITFFNEHDNVPANYPAYTKCYCGASWWDPKDFYNWSYVGEKEC